MAVLIPNEKRLVLLIEIIFWPVQKAAGYHPGPVAPPTADGASLEKNLKQRLIARSPTSADKLIVLFLSTRILLDAVANTL